MNHVDGYPRKPVFRAREAALLTQRCLKPKLDVFDELLRVVTNRIKIAGTWAQSDLLFTVPVYFIGLPNFNSEWMLFLLKAKLDSMGYITVMRPEYRALYISWNHFMFNPARSTGTGSGSGA